MNVEKTMFGKSVGNVWCEYFAFNLSVTTTDGQIEDSIGSSKEGSTNR
jgi:hypothetical protein